MLDDTMVIKRPDFILANTNPIKRQRFNGDLQGSVHKTSEESNLAVGCHSTTPMFGGPGIEYIHSVTGERIKSCIPLIGGNYNPVVIESEFPWKIE